MKKNTATIRELRTDFRGVKRKIEEHGQVVITDRGEPAYLLKPVAREENRGAQPPDYYARLIKQQPEAMTPEETNLFWEEERGGCR